MVSQHGGKMGKQKQKSALIVLNGRASRNDLFDDQVEATLRRHFDVRLERPSDPRQIPEILKTYGPDVDLIVIGGGDGTIGRSAGLLLELGKSVGILPLGTANDLARTLGIPVDMTEAVNVIVSGRMHRIDVGQVNDRHFLNVASIGLAAHVSKAQNVETKKRWKILSYPLSLFRAVRAAKPLRLRIKRDGEDMKLRVFQMGVGNGRFHGGGLAVSDLAAIDDGRLNIYAIVPANHWALATVFFALRFRQHKRNEAVHTFSATKLSVRTSRSVDVNTDGEITTTTPAEFSILPGALPVLVPVTLPLDHIGLEDGTSNDREQQ